MRPASRRYMQFGVQRQVIFAMPCPAAGRKTRNIIAPLLDTRGPLLLGCRAGYP